MHPSKTLLLLFASLAACASQSTGETDWTEVQRERLLRLYQPRDPAMALAVLRQQAPGAQEPGNRGSSGQGQAPSGAARKLDQLEPELAGPRPFLSNRAPITVAVDAGPSSQSVKVRGSRLDDHAEAWVARVNVDGASTSARGPSMQASFMSSDDDLFSGVFISDGFAPTTAAARVRGLDLFPHLRLEAIDAGDLALTLRAGLFVDWFEVDHRAADVQRSWITVGPRVLVEPRWALLGDEEQHFDVFARLGADLGASWFQEDYRGSTSRDLALRGAGTAGLGVRYSFGRMAAELGYELEHAWYGGVTSDLLGQDRRTETDQQRLFFGFSMRF